MFVTVSMIKPVTASACMHACLHLTYNYATWRNDRCSDIVCHCYDVLAFFVLSWLIACPDIIENITFSICHNYIVYPSLPLKSPCSREFPITPHDRPWQLSTCCRNVTITAYIRFLRDIFSLLRNESLLTWWLSEGCFDAFNLHLSSFSSFQLLFLLKMPHFRINTKVVALSLVIERRCCIGCVDSRHWLSLIFWLFCQFLDRNWHLSQGTKRKWGKWWGLIAVVSGSYTDLESFSRTSFFLHFKGMSPFVSHVHFFLVISILVASRVFILVPILY